MPQEIWHRMCNSVIIFPSTEEDVSQSPEVTVVIAILVNPDISVLVTKQAKRWC
jgi:hypothetical protein